MDVESVFSLFILRHLPVIKEAYGKDYPPGTPIQLLSTEHSTYLDDPSKDPSSRLMDIAILVNGTDYYHIESQMDNDHQMVIRMVAYDLHFAIQHNTTRDILSGETILRFPQSIVIYPEPNSHIPDALQCRLIFWTFLFRLLCCVSGHCWIAKRKNYL